MKVWAIGGIYPPMAITREKQLQIIVEGTKRLGIAKHRLEILAGVSVGSIKELERGKRAMTADKWQKIQSVLEQDSQKEQVSEAEIALMDCIKMIFGILIGRGAILESALIQTLSYQYEEYHHQDMTAAMEIIRSLQEHVAGKHHRAEKEIFARLLHIPPQGSA